MAQNQNFELKLRQRGLSFCAEAHPCEKKAGYIDMGFQVALLRPLLLGFSSVLWVLGFVWGFEEFPSLHTN